MCCCGYKNLAECVFSLLSFRDINLHLQENMVLRQQLLETENTLEWMRQKLLQTEDQLEKTRKKLMKTEEELTCANEKINAVLEYVNAK